MPKTLHQCQLCFKIYETEEKAIACESQGITPATPQYKVGDEFTFYDPDGFYENEFDDNGHGTRTITSIVDFGHQRGYVLDKPVRLAKEWRVGCEASDFVGYTDKEGACHPPFSLGRDYPLTDEDIAYLLDKDIIYSVKTSVLPTPSAVNLNWEEVQAFLRAAYAIEFSIVEGELEKTAFRPCTTTVVESEIVFGYYNYLPDENLIIIEKDSLISANLFPSVAQMLLVYLDKRRGWESRLTINFLNKYLPEVD